MTPAKFDDVRYRVEAVQVPARDPERPITEQLEEYIAIAEWCGGVSFMLGDGDQYIRVPGVFMARAIQRDWIVKDSDGRFSVLDDHSFGRMYEPHREAAP